MHILRYISVLTPISLHNELCDLGKLKQHKFKTSAFDGILEQYIYIYYCTSAFLHGDQGNIKIIGYFKNLGGAKNVTS